MTKLLILVALILLLLVVINRAKGVPQPHAEAKPVRQLDPGVQAEIDRQLDAGEPIAAIKTYRQATRAGLKESKDEVELYAASRRQGRA